LAKIILALDAMGGDIGPKITVPAAIATLNKHPHVDLILVGKKDILAPLCSKYPSLLDKRLFIHHADQIVEMNDQPAQTLRNKKQSSMRIAVELVKAKTAHAMVSAGNTGALMAISRFVLKTIEGIDRPAIIARLPANNTRGFVHLLDLGANVDSTADQLLQFAIMGMVMAKAIDGIQSPRMALLNNGKETIKGNELVRQASQKLNDHPVINYVGFVEGDQIFKDIADVIVCDGFVGNIALKFGEGIVRLSLKVTRSVFEQNMFTKLIGFLSQPLLNRVARLCNPSKYNGASFIGLKGMVVKSHGNADMKGFAIAIDRCIAAVENNVVGSIAQQISDLLDLNAL